jgi:malonyl-CoA/methylmalonyl-CoA synthetase
VSEPAPLTLASLFGPAFRDRRSEIGLEWQGSLLTFGEIDQRADRVARELRSRGLRPGDRLCVQLPNGPELVDLFLACVRTGVIFVPINALYRRGEIDHIVRDAAPSALVCRGPLEATVAVETWDVDDLVASGGGRIGPSVDHAQVADPEDQVVAIVYTSGTTGPSKGAMLTQRSFASNARTLLEAWRISAEDRLLLPLPLFHVHGLGNGLHCWLGSGCRLRLLERFDRETIEREFLDFSPTVFFGVPTMYVRLLDTAPDVARRMGATLRLFVSGSAPLDPATFDAFEARFGQAILERYGMTEALMIASNPYGGDRVPGTVGMPLPGVEVRLVDEQGHDSGPGDEGELLVSSPALFAGYWRQPEATEAAFDGSFFRTGDIARRSGAGRLTLCGRKSDVIISAGFNVYPREIEELLVDVPGVADVAVVGVPDAVRGEVPIAYVVPAAADQDLDTDALDARCRAHLASFKRPRRFVRLNELPRNALGKVQKHLLPRAVPPFADG